MALQKHHQQSPLVSIVRIFQISGIGLSMTAVLNWMFLPHIALMINLALLTSGCVLLWYSFILWQWFCRLVHPR